MTAATKTTTFHSKTPGSPAAGDLPWECGRKGGGGSFHKSELVFLSYGPSLPPFPRKTAEEEGGEREGKNDARCPGKKKKKCRRFIYMADGGLGKARVVVSRIFSEKKTSFFFFEYLRTRRRYLILFWALLTVTPVSFPQKIQFPNLALLLTWKFGIKNTWTFQVLILV